ncbi:MAG: TonB-dependent receptor [Phenylobacterium sp.]|uniref:TonB-dependent receptor domain-containing protein n=1 Tax=Phenylobacterium sp. TaxID=1871053 RepID=UPI00271CF7A0|nr:TonB-dependent receptor [Phenylobacterium sp.]MDO8408558.1 TonB-dependent receptor [Phenylobacterium sp.]
MREVIVTADPLGRSGDEVISNVEILSGEVLAQRRQATLGETLVSLPGVTSDAFGGGASRPVIRGQTAPRVKILSDGSSLFDASDVSPDHAVSGEPLLLDGIEVLRGPSALLYGGGAIGGAVNLIDRKIPTALPPAGGEGAVELRYGSGDRERAGVVGVTVGLGAFALRLEGASRRADDYEVPFYTPPAHTDDEHDHEEDHDHEEEAAGFDRLPGSFNRNRTITVGGSWIGSDGYFGVAYTEQDSEYGLPGHNHEYESCHPHGSSLHCGGHDHGGEDHDHDHEHADGHVPIVDLKSRRVDVRGEIRSPFAGVERIRFRGGHTDYAHDEIDDGVVATTFSNKGHELRLEVQHAPIGGLNGVIGVQTSESDFAAVGAESFVPPSTTKNTAIFLLEAMTLGDWRLEGALRQEWQEAEALNRPDTEHRPFSASAGASWTFAPGYMASLNVARSQRAPHAQELYARGIHIASNTYEIGTATLDEETANSIELSLRKTQGPLTFSASAYRYAYEGYIYAATLDRFEDFRLIQYTQDDATFTGVEGQVRYAFANGLAVSAFGDRVKAELDDGGPLPRIPAARLGGRGEFVAGAWSGDLEYIRIFEQDDIAAFETSTPGHDMVNATLAYDFAAGAFDSQLFVRGTNLLDETALSHTSYLSTLAPQRGRSFLVGLRTQF